MNTVLVVDDEPGIIRLCQRLLERARFHVMAVTDPREGMAILQQEDVDLLLVDVRMPGVDGFQVIDLARHRQPDMAVVIMTGYGTVETAIEALRRGADGLVLKPFAGAELVQSVERALQESRHKQDVIRLQTLRPLFTIAEMLFSEAVFGRDPKRLEELLLDEVIGNLKCTIAGLYERDGEADERPQTAWPQTASPKTVSPKTGRRRPLRLLIGRGDPPAIDEGSSKHSVAARAEAWGIPIRANRDGPGDAGLQAGLARLGLSSVMAAPLSASGQAVSGQLAADGLPVDGLGRGPEAAHQNADRERKSGWEAGSGSEKGKGGRLTSSLQRGSEARVGSEARGSRVLVAARRADEPPFRESDLEIFAILSRQAAIALENAVLHAELRATLRQVEESQRALIQAEKMAIAGRLTASIAHEVNNPLQAVQNCLHLAGRKELPAEDRQGYLELAQTELERLMHTVQQMLDYYRPAAVDRRPVEINALVQRVLSLLEKQLEDRHIRLITRFEAGLPQAWAVADQIQQVLFNLVLNAMEAMKGGGRLTIQTGAREEGGARQIEVVVEDSGPGIPKEQRERIFEPSFSSKDGGTGLGLAISYGIMAAHGGSLDLISWGGGGKADEWPQTASPQTASRISGWLAADGLAADGLADDQNPASRKPALEDPALVVQGARKGACFRLSLPAGAPGER